MNKLNDFIQKYDGIWSNHPDYPVDDWRFEVMNNDTRLGYWEWAFNKVEEREHLQEINSLKKQLIIFRTALEKISTYPANGNSEADRMAFAIDDMESIALQALRKAGGIEK